MTCDYSIGLDHDQELKRIYAVLLEATGQMDEWMFLQFERFITALPDLPPSGGGGLHTALLGLANHAVRFGLKEEAFLLLVRPHICGSRMVTDGEIRGAYRKAAYDYLEGDNFGAGDSAKNIKPFGDRRQTRTGAGNKQLIIERDQLIADGRGVTMVDIQMASPVMIPQEPVAQAVTFLRGIGEGTEAERFYLGGCREMAWPEKNLKNWIGWKLNLQRRKDQKVPWAHIVLNPLTGQPAPKKDGSGTSYRCDAAVSRFRFALAEFDNLPLEDQLAFWSQVPLKIAALIYSGGKSIHAWIPVEDVQTLAQWQEKVRGRLYAEYLIPMGVDSACCNPSRLSRMPGHVREESGKMQELLYFCPAGKEGPII